MAQTFAAAMLIEEERSKKRNATGYEIWLRHEKCISCSNVVAVDNNYNISIVAS